MQKGQKVVAINNIGGIFGPHIPKGTVGIVTESGWFSTKVMFKVEGFLSYENIEVEVNDKDIQ